MPNDAQQALNAKLADAAENGSVSEVVSLIAAGGDVNGKHCLDGCQHTPLIKAAMKGHLSVVSLLLEKGADTSLVASEGKTAIEMAREAGKQEVVARIVSFEESKRPDRISFHSHLGDRTREDIYDFSMRERVTLIRQGRLGTVETAIITGFSAIEDQSDTSMLRKAFNEHVCRGGKTEESVVFSRNIAKSKLGIPRAL